MSTNRCCVLACIMADNKTNKMEEVSIINNLMAQMTLEEKLGQLNLITVGDGSVNNLGKGITNEHLDSIKSGHVGGILNIWTSKFIRPLQELCINNTRLKIPLLCGLDIIHGHRTIFPINLAMSCMWDMNLIEQSARIAAKEAGSDGLQWTFSPMVDISRDPRWGRVAEGAGEDPYLGSQIAMAMIRGYQQDDLSRNDTIMACVKHFALYGACESGREYNTVDMSQVKMFQYYLPPFEAAVKAGVQSLMASFNEINGIPATANKWLLNDLLRNTWKFNDLIVSDYGAILELQAHGLVGNLQDASTQALNATVDFDMVSFGYLKTLEKSLNDGKIDQNQIDLACRRILMAKYRLGLFDDPYRYCNDNNANIPSNEHRLLAKEIAKRSFVLLKNDKQILPLNCNSSTKILLTGPLAMDKRNLLGSWSAGGLAEETVSIYEGIKHLLKTSSNLIYSKGCNLIEDPRIINMLNRNIHNTDVHLDKELSPEKLLEQTIETIKLNDIDVIICVLGEQFMFTGEAASRSNLNLFEIKKSI
ncbi:unnamed protein product [Didymodactylos carnosus]|uniref:beta-glucosidase n=1 Tax=Didymodactylos carnosus TaxID=1234261 RepID=A0A816B148_9BILA|nr:unnamed protein product [Didymodactylos carnosus]CAF4483054.1 unnamed protein product [Didymodactylos carnosus]